MNFFASFWLWANRLLLYYNSYIWLSIYIFFVNSCLKTDHFFFDYYMWFLNTLIYYGYGCNFSNVQVAFVDGYFFVIHHRWCEDHAYILRYNLRKSDHQWVNGEQNISNKFLLFLNFEDSVFLCVFIFIFTAVKSCEINVDSILYFMLEK